MEDERSPGGQTISHISPQPIHLSPSRQSSSSTELECPTGTIVAKKKRELFSARSSRSGGSNKSSSEYSRDYSFSSKVSTHIWRFNIVPTYGGSIFLEVTFPRLTQPTGWFKDSIPNNFLDVESHGNVCRFVCFYSPLETNGTNTIRLEQLVWNRAKKALPPFLHIAGIVVLTLLRGLKFAYLTSNLPCCLSYVDCFRKKNTTTDNPFLRITPCLVALATFFIVYVWWHCFSLLFVVMVFVSAAVVVIFSTFFRIVFLKWKKKVATVSSCRNWLEKISLMPPTTMSLATKSN